MPAEAWRWISERRFVAIAEALPATASKDSVKPRVFIERRTGAWAAWGPVWRQKNGGRHGPASGRAWRTQRLVVRGLYPSAADEGEAAVHDRGVSAPPSGVRRAEAQKAPKGK